MSAIVKCPTCQRALRLPLALHGKTVKCAACKTNFVAAPPREETSPPSAPIAIAPSRAEPEVRVLGSREQQAPTPARPEPPIADVIPVVPGPVSPAWDGPAPRRRAQRRRPAESPDSDLDGTPGPMPGSILAVVVILGLSLVLSLAQVVLWAVLDPSRAVGPAVGMIVVGLLLWGTLARQRLAWQWARVLVPLGGALYSLIGVFLVVQAVDKGQPEYWTGAVLVFLLVLLLLAIFFACGQRSARVYFGLICPECGFHKGKPMDFFFRRVRCGACGHLWTWADLARRDEGDDRPHATGIPAWPARRRERTAAGGSRVALYGVLGLVGLAVLGAGGWIVISWFAGGGAWKPFAPPGGRFSVLLPGKPMHERKTTPSPAGPIAYDAYTVNKRFTDLEFVFGYSDLPAMALRAPADQRLDGARDGLVRSMLGSRLLGQRSVTVDGHPGRELDLEVPEKGRAIWRLYMVHGRLYQLAVAGKYVKPDSDDVVKYFDSFKLVGTAPAVAVGAKPAPTKSPSPAVAAKPAPSQPSSPEATAKPAPSKPRLEELSVAELVALVKNANAGTHQRREAVLILIRRGPAAREAMPALAALLEQEKENAVLQPLIEGLGTIDPQAAGPLLVKYMKEARTAAYRDSILSALGKLRPVAPQTLSALIDELKQEKSNPRGRAKIVIAMALREMGAEAHEAIPVLSALLQKESNAEARRSIVDAMTRIACPAAVPALLRILKDDPDYRARELAVTLLGPMRPVRPEIVAALTDALTDRPKNEARGVQLYAIRALGEMGPEARSASKVLQEMMRNKELWVNRSNDTLNALIRIDPLAAGPVLVEILRAPKSDLLTTALRALAELRPVPPGAVEALAAIVANEKRYHPHRLVAVQTLGELGPEAKAAIPTLQEVRARNKGKKDVEMMIDRALKRIQGP